MDDIMSIDKKEDLREQSIDSTDSTPDPENEAGPSNADNNPEQPKRKGGRKPIYATSEERKQRNRQAQAAFRERRTEYIKQLEETIRVHETNLHSLQTAHRSAADECLMLRYKNSLLERILLEKGIDVQAELRAKTGSPSLGPTHMPQNMAQPPTIQRAIMNRHQQARRTNSSIAPKMEPGAISTLNPLSPQSRPTPTSHNSSPTSNSPAYQTQTGLTPPGSEPQPQLQQPPPPRLHQQVQHQMGHGMQASGLGVMNQAMAVPMKGMESSDVAGIANVAGAYYPPPFRNHIKQLEQEYDAQADLVDEQEPPDLSSPGPYAAPYGQRLPLATQQHLGMQPPQQQQQQHPRRLLQQQSMPLQAGDNGPGYNSMAQLLDPFDPMLDLDPFGLSASMHFPTQFNFDTSSMR